MNTNETFLRLARTASAAVLIRALSRAPVGTRIVIPHDATYERWDDVNGAQLWRVDSRDDGEGDLSHRGAARDMAERLGRVVV